MHHQAQTNGTGAAADFLDRLHALEQENVQLQRALDSRIVIEQAKGAISARRGISTQDAFDLLRNVARSERRKIHEVAIAVIASHGHVDATPPPGE